MNRLTGRTCKTCRKDFLAYQSEATSGRARFCSQACKERWRESHGITQDMIDGLCRVGLSEQRAEEFVLDAFHAARIVEGVEQ